MNTLSFHGILGYVQKRKKTTTLDPRFMRKWQIQSPRLFMLSPPVAERVAILKSTLRSINVSAKSAFFATLPSYFWILLVKCNNHLVILRLNLPSSQQIDQKDNSKTLILCKMRSLKVWGLHENKNHSKCLKNMNWSPSFYTTQKNNLIRPQQKVYGG